MKYILNKRKYIIPLFIIIALILFAFSASRIATSKIINEYKKRQSSFLFDRNGQIIALKKNHLGYYAEFDNNPPEDFTNLLLKKEDRYFFYHVGINPFSTLRAVKNYLLGKGSLASSTITQQLAKILLSTEVERTLKNKIKEAFFALAIEIQLSKKEILKMYCNSIFLGNNTQGITTASRLYFDSSPDMLTESQTISLIATIDNPTNNNPFKKNNSKQSKKIADALSLQNKANEIKQQEKEILTLKFNNYRSKDSLFEINSLPLNCEGTKTLSLDNSVMEKTREILKRNLDSLAQKNATNGAVVVIKIPENEILAIVGSPDPSIENYGYKINMAIRPRTIGSTVKPFIYLKGFENNLRPYTLIEDKEYKYTIGTGFAFYPKNYDYEYRGEVTLHYALTNSLNIPTIKVLEYVGLKNFYTFLLADLEFTPIQSLENYQYGIALGGLEMDLMRLCHYFTIFPNNGELIPLKISKNENCFFKNNDFSQNKTISTPPYIQLINKLLSDRKTGVEQFGQKSNLTLPAENYSVKTGTSREYNDSWTIGYTPDFLVGVWIGNSNDAPMEKISGQSGAGRIWQETMTLLINSEYNEQTKFNFSLVKEFQDGENISYGLSYDNFEKYKNLLKDDSIILNPHNNDEFLLEKNTQIPLKARTNTKWLINGNFLTEDKEALFIPEATGAYTIKAIEAESENPREEEIIIYLNIEE